MKASHILRLSGQLAICLALLGTISARAGKSVASGPAKAREGAPVFQVGEKLQYRISWASLMTAATAELAVNEKRPFYGREAWHFQALARTTDLARSLYELDNQFDSYADPATLASFRYEAYLREQGKKETSVVRMSGQGLPVQDDGAMVRVAPGTRDPLGVLYYLRTIDWSRQPQVVTPVFTGRRLFEIQATLTKSAPVTVAAGTYTASRVELRVTERKKELDNVRIWIWLADDETRTPALIEAEMPFGKLRVELVRASLERKSAP